MQTLTIIDGSGFLFRARYAFPPFLDSEGKNQNVVYGFIRMMLKLLFDENSEYFVIARDSPIKTKRHEHFPDYKANRKDLEDEFRLQIPLVQQLVQELEIPHLVAPGYEADDIIATLVSNYQHHPDLMIKVYSSDKDLKQFLDENISIIDPIKNEATRVIDFHKEFGFAPESIVDYLALIGDSADNIKGVPGIGPKKASFLIQTYANLETIYEHLPEIPGDLRSKLLAAREEAFFSKSLIQLLQVPDLRNIPLEQFLLHKDLDHREWLLTQKKNFSDLNKVFTKFRKKLEQPQQIGLF